MYGFNDSEISVIREASRKSADTAPPLGPLTAKKIARILDGDAFGERSKPAAA